MSEIRLKIYLPSNNCSTIFVDDDEQIFAGIQDVLKNNTVFADVADLKFMRNDSLPVSGYSSFLQSGFKNGDQLYISYKQSYRGSSSATAFESPTVMSDKNHANHNENTLDAGMNSASAQMHEVIGMPAGGHINTAANIRSRSSETTSHTLKPARHYPKGIVYAILTGIILMIVGSYFLFPWFRNTEIAKYTTTPIVTPPTAQHDKIPRKLKKPGGNFPRESKHGSSVTMPPSPPIIESLSLQEYFDKLSDSQIPDKKKMIYKKSLLSYFISGDVPVIKMNGGRATNTGTTIEDYVESIILLGTHVIITDEEYSGQKISKINVLEK